jgi:hypothetical protein
MLRILKQLFFGILLGVFLLGAFVFGYFYFNQNKIVELLIEEVNRNINTKLDVQQVSMSFWERFPQISIKFETVTLHNSNQFSQKTDLKLLETEYVYFDLDLKTLISDKPEIKRIAVGPGNMNLLVDKNKFGNYDILKGSDGDASQLEIGNLEIKSLDFNYLDYGNSDQHTLSVVSAYLSANFSSESKKFDLNLTIQKPSFIPAQYNTFENYGFVGEIEILDDTEITWFGIANLDDIEVQNRGQYEINTSTLLIDSKAFTVSQSLVSNVIRKFEIPLETDKMNLAFNDVRLLFSPANFTLSFNYAFSGIISIKNYFNSIRLENNGSATLENRKLNVKIEKIKAQFKNSNFDFAGKYKFPSHQIDGNLSFHTELSDFDKSIKGVGIEELHGIVEGNLQLVPSKDKKMGLFAFSKGEIGLTNVSFRLTDNHLSIEDVQSLMFLSEDEISIEELKGIVNKNDIEFSGTTRGLVDYVFSDGVLSVTGDVFSNEFYLSDFLYASPESQSGTIQLGENLNLMLDIIVKDLRNNNFNGDNLSLGLEKIGHNLKIKNFDIQTSKGHLSGNGVFIEQDNGEWYTTISSNIQQIDIGNFFAEMNEFGQSYIVSDNLEGKLDAKINADFVFSPEFRVKTESIYLDADIVVSDGRLINYKTLEALSDFVSLDELRDIKFETLKNRITIHNDKITIPKMQIRSSALDLGVVGEHGFNDSIDYQISVGLSDVLFGKLPRRLRKDSKRQKNKKLTIFVDITGNINDPSVSVSRISREKVIDDEPKTEEKKKKFEIEFDDF